MSSNDKVFLFVADGRYSNRGCEAIVRGTIEIISKQFPQSRFILCPFGLKEELQKDAENETDPRIEHLIPKYPVFGFRRFSPLWWKYRILLRSFPAMQRAYQFEVQHKALERADCALVLGGDNYSLDYGIPKTYLDMGEQLLSTNKPVVLWGASIGPFTSNPQVENIIKKTLPHYHLITVRETETLHYLKNIGIEKNVRLVADPAFVMPPQQPDLSNSLMDFIKNGAIGLNFSPTVGRFRSGSTQGKDEWIKYAGKCISNLLNTNISPLLLIPHVFDSWNNDYTFMFEAVEKGPGWSNNIKILPPTLSSAEYKWCISKMRCFIGARTHTTIAALSTCTPTISIGYSMKARGINKDIFGHLNWLLPIKDLTPDILSERVRNLFENDKLIRIELENKIPEFQRRAQTAADFLTTP